MTSTEIKKRPGDVIVFSDDSIRSTVKDGLQAIHRPQAINNPPIRPFKSKDRQWILMNESSPSSQFLHFYPSVCTSYAAVCSPYALFRLKQEARRE